MLTHASLPKEGLCSLYPDYVYSAAIQLWRTASYANWSLRAGVLKGKIRDEILFVLNKVQSSRSVLRCNKVCWVL